MSEKFQLLDKLSSNKKTREAYVRAKVSTNVPSQIRAMRRRRNDMTQKELALAAEMKQSRISAMERPGTRFNLETLVRLAAAFKVGLVVKFVSFSEMLDWEEGFNQDEFEVVSIDNDVDLLGTPVQVPALARMGDPTPIRTFSSPDLLRIHEAVTTTVPMIIGGVNAQERYWLNQPETTYQYVRLNNTEIHQ